MNLFSGIKHLIKPIEALESKRLKIPQFLYITITTECNYHCKHCHLWMTKESHSSLTTDEKIEAIKQFHQMNPNGTIIISGGEPMKKEFEYFSLSRLCRNLKLNTISITNGSYIKPENYEKLLKEGPKQLIISLDGYTKEVHDYIRGVQGSFKYITKMLRELTDMKRNIKSDVNILTNTVLFDKNIYDIENFLPFAKSLGTDGALFQCFHEVPQHTDTNLSVFAKKEGRVQNINEGLKGIDKLIELSKNNGFIKTRIDDFEWMKLYISGADFTQYDKFCDSHDKNIIIDDKGNYSLCFEMHGIDGIGNIGNFRELSIIDFWYSIESVNARKIMDFCRKDCGILGCHRKENMQMNR